MFKNIIVIIGVLTSLISCDSRKSAVNPPSGASFDVDFTAVRDFSTSRSVVRILFDRNGFGFEDAQITINNIPIPSAGGGIYYLETPNIVMPLGIDSVRFRSHEDTYDEIIEFVMPEIFGVTEIDPWFNANGDDVDIRWTSAPGATRYALIVMASNWEINGTDPLRVYFDLPTTSFTIPDTTFETTTGMLVPDVYYIYLVAFNGGFGSYGGMTFFLPEGIPARPLSEPSGYMRYGTVAPRDSIVVPN